MTTTDRPLQRRNRHTNWAIVGIAALMAALVITIVFVTGVKLDDKASHTQATADAIYARQTVNLEHSNAIARCQINGFNEAFEALALGFAGDKNGADYPKRVQCNLPAVAPAKHKRRS